MTVYSEPTTVEAQASVSITPPVVFVEPPPLVDIEPDVYVVEDYEEPVYYTGGHYWLYRGNTWYQTSSWDRPWVHVSVNVVPPKISRRDHRHYVRYRDNRHDHVWREPRERDGHRTLRQEPRRARVEAHVRADAHLRVDADRARREREQEAARARDRERAQDRARAQDRERDQDRARAAERAREQDREREVRIRAQEKARPPALRRGNDDDDRRKADDRRKNDERKKKEDKKKKALKDRR